MWSCQWWGSDNYIKICVLFYHNVTVGIHCFEYLYLDLEAIDLEKEFGYLNSYFYHIKFKR